MRALVCEALGDPTLPPGAPGAALTLRELPTPTLRDTDVLIQARCVGVGVGASVAPRRSAGALRAAVRDATE